MSPHSELKSFTIDILKAVYHVVLMMNMLDDVLSLKIFKLTNRRVKVLQIKQLYKPLNSYSFRNQGKTIIYHRYFGNNSEGCPVAPALLKSGDNYPTYPVRLRLSNITSIKQTRGRLPHRYHQHYGNQRKIILSQ
jgi:hypothetical protein